MHAFNVDAFVQIGANVLVHPEILTDLNGFQNVVYRPLGSGDFMKCYSINAAHSNISRQLRSESLFEFCIEYSCSEWSKKTKKKICKL